MRQRERTMRPVGADAEPSTARSNGRAASLVSTVHPRTVASLREHPDAATIPLLPPQEYAELRADIRNRGVQDPLLVLGDGTVIDGRHRLRVARELGLLTVPCLESVPAPGQDPYERMLRSAVLRRHLTPGQRAALALELVACQERRARDRSGRLRDSPRVAESNPLVAGRAREVAAGLGSVSARTVQAVATVRQEAPDLYEEVRSGTRSANDAARELRRRSPNRRNPCRDSATTSELTRAIAAVERVVHRLQEARENADRGRKPGPVQGRLARCARESAARLRAVAKLLERLVGGSKSERPDR